MSPTAISSYQPLHHKYRPQRFDQLVGQEAIAATLGNALRTGRIAPAYLFCGPRGTGKTSSARILARSLNCIGSDGPTPEPCGVCELCTSIAAGNALDVIEIDAASNTGVDNIRELIERSRFAPVQARWKVYVVDECHMLSTAAFNALLKTLEEPPPRVVFVLATTDPQRVLATILSRCQRFDFRRIPLQALEQHLSWIADQEQIGITPEALHVVAQRAQGGLRDAESLLDQLSLLPAPIEATAVWELLGAVPEQELLALAGALASCDPLALLEGCRELLERGREPAAVLQGLVSLLRDLVLAGTAPDRLELTSVSPQFRQALPDLARSLGKARLLQWQAQLRGSEQQLRHSVNPRLWLEVLLLGLLAEPVAAAQPISAAAPAVAPLVAPPIAPAVTTTVTSAVAPIPAPAPVSVEPNSSANLPELWQQILAGLELPSTRMLLSQQARLVRLDERRAVVQVAGNWMAMVQSRLPLLEAAVAKALGSPRQLTLEGGGESAAPTGGARSATTPSAAIASATPRPTPPPPTPAPLANPAPLPSPAALPNPAADPPAAAAIAPPLAAPLDDKARRLAEFFNGEVVELDGPLDELTGDALTCDAEEAAA
ncbi:DNA polymerase III subunit gamma/tau [Cyanobium sp. WKJ7-Wakatipu]|uniref:DNA polymerase III subunit gamma/tau n=1 Tax=Cyanobium sp. WKJ7-Wakatipu TaxID=2823726 RepID=UPI0020CF382F|nr:DNA polymerase III subunit gamma/tau [Cyanobium sp. WKJ7-Wakatipu]MCP9783658.1 DNA polymerase III subunit gamma/tau [Cyanobium sp. WKJ7-Wakatipu]